MPPKNTVEDRILLYSADGANYSSIPDALSASNIIDIVVSRETDYIRDQGLFSPQWALYGTFVFPHKKISRRTFKKWLMQHSWIDRNSVENWCRLIAVANGRVSYGRTYQDMTLDPTFLGLFNSFARQLKETEK